MNTWLNSTEFSDVFMRLKLKMISVIEESFNMKNSTSGNDAVYVYLAADNQQVKEAFEDTIKKDEKHGIYNFSIKVMTVDTKFVQHIKNLAKMKSDTNDEGTFTPNVLTIFSSCRCIS